MFFQGLATACTRSVKFIFKKTNVKVELRFVAAGYYDFIG